MKNAPRIRDKRSIVLQSYRSGTQFKNHSWNAASPPPSLTIFWCHIRSCLVRRLGVKTAYYLYQTLLLAGISCTKYKIHMNLSDSMKRVAYRLYESSLLIYHCIVQLIDICLTSICIHIFTAILQSIKANKTWVFIFILFFYHQSKFEEL